jgi:hypothetical protein
MTKSGQHGAPFAAIQKNGWRRKLIPHRIDCDDDVILELRGQISIQEPRRMAYYDFNDPALARQAI